MASSASSSRIPPPTRSRRRSDHRHYHHHLYLAILLSTLLNTAAHGLSTEPDPTTPSPPALILQLNSSHQLPLQLTQQPPQRLYPVDDFHSAQINIYTTPGNETNHTFQPDRALLQRSRSSVFLGEQTAVVPRPHFINFTRLLMHRSTTPKTPLTTPKKSIQRKYIFIDKTTPRTKTIHDWSKRQSVAQSLITSKPSKSAKSLIKIKVVEGSDQVLVFDKTTTILPTPDSSSLANLSPTVTEAIENILRKRQSESDLMLTKSGARTRTGRPRMTTTAVPTTTLAPTTTTASTVPETTSTGSISTSTTDRDQTETTTPLWTTVTAPDIASTENATTISMFNVDVKNIQNEEFAAEMSTVSSTVLFEDNRELTDSEVATTTPRTTLRFDHSSSKLATEVIETSSTPSLSTSSSSPSPTEDQISSKATSSWGVNQTPASGSVYRQCHFSLLHLCPRLSMAKYASIRNMIACFGDGTIRCDKRSGKFCKMIPKEPFGGEFGESGEYAGGYESAESRIAESAEASPSSSSGYFFCNVPLTTELCFGTARCEMPSTTTSTSTTIVPETTAPQTTTISSLAEAKVEQTTLITAEELNKLNQQNPAENTISNEPADLSLSKLEPAPSHHRPLSPLKIGLISALIAIGSLIVILVTIVAYISWSKLKNIKQQVSPTGGHTNPITSFWSTSTSATPEMRPANGEPTPLSMTPKIDITEASKINNSAAAAAHHNESPVI